MQPLSHKRIAIALITILLSGGAYGCKRENKYIAPPPPNVTVERAARETVVDSVEFTGTTQAALSVDIRARVQGVLQNVYFKPSTLVKKGEPLFLIDPRSYQAEVDKAAAELDNQKAQYDLAEIELKRNERLFKENAASERDLVKARATRDSAKASVGIAAASLDDARIKLGYTSITAPISGLIGRSMVDPGNLVGANESTLLANIKQYDPIYVYFHLNENYLLRMRKIFREGFAKRQAPEGGVVIQLGLADEDGYPHEGKLDFVESSVDPDTGTILLRGFFPNPPPYALMPGLFVRLRIPAETRENALLVSDRSLGVDQLGDYLLVVNAENVVERRQVKTGAVWKGMRVIEDGLTADDWFVANALQKAQPGMKVNPVKAAEPPNRERP
ncbi:MAG: efflux RND transporter periplasmic adaptor subunit [Syntrophobacteraceae bacterium]